MSTAIATETIPYLLGKGRPRAKKPRRSSKVRRTPQLAKRLGALRPADSASATVELLDGALHLVRRLDDELYTTSEGLPPLLAFDLPLCRRELPEVLSFILERLPAWREGGRVPPRCYVLLEKGILTVSKMPAEEREPLERQLARTGATVSSIQGETFELRGRRLAKRLAPLAKQERPVPSSWPRPKDGPTPALSAKQKQIEAGLVAAMRLEKCRRTAAKVAGSPHTQAVAKPSFCS